jgi:hypothetical protein
VSSTSRITSPASAQKLTGVYGILIAAGHVELVRPDGTIAASAPITGPSLGGQGCGDGEAAWVQPPVSASDDQMYFRDGDTTIRMLVPPSGAVEVTRVPGGPRTVSFFSVSPDDNRIAVLVEDLSAAPTTIGLRLYVEDLHGGGNHADIYTTTVGALQPATTLWPMGWHQDRLVLAVWAPCSFEPVPYPSAWHVVDSTSAVRQASIGDAGCIPSAWPSRAGISCFDFKAPGHIRVYDWNGNQVAILATDTGAAELSPSGDLLAVGNGGGLGDPSPSTTIFRTDGSGLVTTPGHKACLWIDENHLLSRDAVIGYPSGAATALPQAGTCAGRFPGGL